MAKIKIVIDIIKKKITVAIIIGFFIGQLISGVTGFFVVAPLIDFVAPADIFIAPIYHPIIKDGQEFVQINIKNGRKTLNNLIIDYGFGQANLEHRELLRQLNPAESISVDFQSKLGLNCTLITEMKCNIYLDTNIDKCYHDCEKITCNFQNLTINVKSNEFTKKLTVLYPVRGHFWLDIGFNNKQCNSIENTENLIVIGNVTVLDVDEYPPLYCDRKLFSQEKCLQEGFDYSKSPKFNIVFGNENYTDFYPVLSYEKVVSL